MLNATQKRRAQKLLSLVQPTTTEVLPLPVNTWKEFAPMTKIRSGAAGFTSFVPYQYQLDLIELIEECPKVVIAKSRQLGATESIASYFLFKCLLEPSTACCFFSMNQSSSSAVARRVKDMCESIKPYARLKTDNLMLLEFSNGSSIHFRSGSLSASRGLPSIRYLAFDEFEFQENANLLLASILPATSMLGDKARLILLSTPGSQSSDYYGHLTENCHGEQDILSICDSIREGKQRSTFFKLPDGSGRAILHHSDHPIYSQSEDYLESVRVRFGLPEDQLQREYNLSFQSDARQIFPTSLVRQFEGEMIKKAEDGWDYYLGVDPNFTNSKNGDFFVASVLGCRDGVIKLVDLYRKRNVSNAAHVFAITELADKYKPRTIQVESNGGGAMLIEQLHLELGSTRIEGTFTSQTSKETNLSRLKLALEQDVLKLPKLQILIDEFLGYMRLPNNKLGNLPGNNRFDDCVCSLMIALIPTSFTGRKTIQFKVKGES